MKAVILGGTGAIGGAASELLARRGWQVHATGRYAERMPPELVDLGVAFHRVDRGGTPAIERLIGAGADLLVDCLVYCARDVRALLPAMTSIRSIVVISSRAVYVDEFGQHINSERTESFPVPVTEDTATVPPAGDDDDPFSREGYAAGKVAAERTALDSGLPITIIRPARVHGRWARNPRTRSLVERMLASDSPLTIPSARLTIDQLTAARNTAALIEHVARHPGARILNSADPGSPTVGDVAAAVASSIGKPEFTRPADETDRTSEHPLLRSHRMQLDTSASQRLGYRPAGTALELIGEEARRVAAWPHCTSQDR